MKQRLMAWMVAILTFGVALFIQPVAWSFERQTPNRIPSDQIFAPFLSEHESDSVFCVIQNDNGSAAYYYSKFDSGMGFAVYMDPAKCASQPTYPFKITDVHFQLYAPSGIYKWPVAIRVNIRDLSQGDSCAGPQGVLCSEDFSIPSNLAYPDTINLSLSTPCLVNHPFFLEIIYTEKSDTLLHLHPSFLMALVPPPADTCKNWFIYSDLQYSEWYDSWNPPIPGDAVIRATGYTNASAVEEEESGLTPRDFELYQNHPNPFNSETVIKFNLSKPSFVTVAVYNILGQKAKTLVEGHLGTGLASVSWDGKDEKGNDLASGIYFYQLKSGELTQTKRLLLLK